MENFYTFLIVINGFAALVFFAWWWDNRKHRIRAAMSPVRNYHICFYREQENPFKKNGKGDDIQELFNMDLHSLMDYIDLRKELTTTFYSRSLIHFVAYKHDQ